jgi:hypothetical protein
MCFFEGIMQYDEICERCDGGRESHLRRGRTCCDLKLQKAQMDIVTFRRILPFLLKA